MPFEISYWAMIGIFGIWCIEASYVPQILRLWRRRNADDVSVFFPGLNLVGRLAAFTYALHVGESVFVVGFLVGIFLRATLLGQVVWYRANPEHLHGSGSKHHLNLHLGEAAA